MTEKKTKQIKISRKKSDKSSDGKSNLKNCKWHLFLQFFDIFQTEKIIRNWCSNCPPSPRSSPPLAFISRHVSQSAPDLHHGARYGDTTPLHCNTHRHLCHYSAYPPQQTKLQTINSKQQEESPVTPTTHRFINGRLRGETPKRGLTRLVWDLMWGFFFFPFFLLKKGLRAGRKRVTGQ